MITKTQLRHKWLSLIRYFLDTIFSLGKFMLQKSVSGINKHCTSLYIAHITKKYTKYYNTNICTLQCYLK